MKLPRTILNIGHYTLAAALACSLLGCGLLQEKPASEDDIEIVELTKKPLPPEKSEKLLKEVGSNWLYGQGVGETALNVGTSVIFPPYAIYYLGNMAISASGYEPLYVTNALPEEHKEAYDGAYGSVTGAPGKFAAAIAGEEYRTQAAAKESIKKVLKESPQGDADRLEEQK